MQFKIVPGVSSAGVCIMYPVYTKCWGVYYDSSVY